MSRHARHRRLRLSAPVRASSLQSPASSLRLRPGLTLIEMLVALAITLLMMAAVVNLFANMSGSIRNRRAVLELSGQLRQVRQRLALDLAGATCPASTWQRPGDDPGYIEIVEGQATDLNPSSLLDQDVDGANGELDYAVSIIPRNNIVGVDDDLDGDRKIDDAEMQKHLGDGDSLLPGGLGDYDDILALTVRSENEPFVAQHQGQSVESKLAEVVWFAIENPANGALGEPGLRSIYRRALLIAPGLDPIPGPQDPTWYFQRFDVSAHYDTSRGAWIPNTLGDLTKRENRFYRSGIPNASSPYPQPYPHALASGGAGFNRPTVNFVRTTIDQQQGDAQATAFVSQGTGNVNSFIVLENEGGRYDDLPTVAITENNATQLATARPVMAPDGPGVWKVAQLTFGPAPLSIHRQPTGPNTTIVVDRTGEDLMLTDALAFDVRVYDPGAPVFLNTKRNVIVEPSDPAWFLAFKDGIPPASDGAYVDMGWYPGYFDLSEHPAAWYAGRPRPVFNQRHQAGWHPRFAYENGLFPFGEPGVYDTWSVHYESDGIDQDPGNSNPAHPTVVDQGTNGVDDWVFYPDDGATPQVMDQRDGVDDAGERETAPPYDTPLRGLQVRLRLFERSARQIRETSVTQSLVP